MCGRTFWRSYISSRRRAAVVCSTLALAFASTARNFVGTQLVKAAQTESASAAEAAPRVGGKSSVQSEASAPAFALKRAQKKKSARPPRSWRAQLRAIGAHVRSGRIISAQAIWSSPISPNSFVFFSLTADGSASCLGVASSLVWMVQMPTVVSGKENRARDDFLNRHTGRWYLPGFPAASN